MNISLRDRLFRSLDLDWMTWLADRFLLPPPSCLFRICVPTFSAAALKFCLPLTTSAISGTANPNKSAPICLAAGTTFFFKKGVAVLSIIWARAPNPRPRCLPIPLYYGSSTSLETTIWYTFSIKNENQTLFWTWEQIWLFPQKQLEVSPQTYHANEFVHYERSFSTAYGIVDYWMSDNSCTVPW